MPPLCVPLSSRQHLEERKLERETGFKKKTKNRVIKQKPSTVRMLFWFFPAFRSQRDKTTKVLNVERTSTYFPLVPFLSPPLLFASSITTVLSIYPFFLKTEETSGESLSSDRTFPV